MGQRRMFSPQIIDSDAFLDMSSTAQALYFHLGMRADDDGFVGNPKKILRMIGGNDDDLKILLAKRFILTFDSGVIVIKHWRINNLVRKDWYKETIYQEEKNSLKVKENGGYTELGNENETIRTRRLGKVRLGYIKKEVSATADGTQLIKNTKEVIDYYLIKAERALGEKPIINWGICIKLATPMVNTLGFERMKLIIDRYFISDDELPQKNRYDIKTMLSAYMINKLK